jgi:hypothetical protein
MNSNASPDQAGGDTVRRFSSPTDIRSFRLAKALQAIEDALLLLESRPAEGIEISALERVRDDLTVLLRTGT